MNAESSERDRAFDALLTDAMREETEASRPDRGRAPDEAWRSIDRRRRHASRVRVLWPVAAAAAVVAVAVVGSTFARDRGAVIEMQPGASTGAVHEPDPMPGSTLPGPEPTVPAPTSTGSGDTVAPEVPGASPTTPAPPLAPSGDRPRDIRSIELNMLAVPTSMCTTGDRSDASPAVVPLGSDFTVQVPKPVPAGQPPASISQPMAVRYGSVTYADISGDGVEDALVFVRCMFGGQMADMYWARAVVVDGAAASGGQPSAGPVLATSGAPLVEDDVPSADGGGLNETRGRKHLFESMVGLRIHGGEVVATWVQTANPVIPRVNQWSRRVESRHRIQGSSVVAVGATQIQPWVRDPYGSVLPFGPTSL